jgi:hypothetical protein
MLRSILYIILIWVSAVWAEDPDGLFAARVVKINTMASLVRLKIDFHNMRYLNKKDKVEFWQEAHSENRCSGFIIGKTNEYILVRISNYNECYKKIQLALGGYIKLWSPDLVNNLKMGRELMEILVKKRFAIAGQLGRKSRELDIYMEKVKAINDRYALLREKLEAEWRDELANLEETKMTTLNEYNDIKIRLNEIDAKMEQYRVDDHNMSLDRWALDSRLFYRK